MRMWPTHSWPRRSIFLAANRLQHQQQLQQSCQFLVQETNEPLCLWYMDWRLLLVHWTVSPAISCLLWNPLSQIRSIARFPIVSMQSFLLRSYFVLIGSTKESLFSFNIQSVLLSNTMNKIYLHTVEEHSQWKPSSSGVVTQLCNVKLHESRKWYSFFQGYCFNNSILPALSHRLNTRAGQHHNTNAARIYHSQADIKYTYIVNCQ